MPIKKGNTTIGAIYKGTTQIAKVYKGTKLLFENAVWLDYYFNNLYHDLVPETISSKSVKNKAKVSVIEANGVIENQLTDYLNTAAITPYGMNASISNGVLKATVIDTTNPLINFDTFESVIGHKYFCSFELKKPYATKVYIIGGASFYLDQTPVANTWTSLSAIYTATNQVSPFTFYPFILDNRQVNDECEIRNFNVIDLTLMFGTGNEPTTLTDNRIQALLNRGYIPYNTGSYKGTDIGLFSSEPYNLFDGEMSIGTFTNTNTTNCHSNNYIKVLPRTSYTFENGDLYTNKSNGFYYIEYDEYFNTIGSGSIAIYGALSSQNKTSTFTTNSATHYIRFFLYIDQYNFTNNFPTQLSIHRTGTRTGYAPYQSFTPIAFKYQGNGAINAHDTMTVTKDNVVFGKNVGSVDMGTLDWDYVGGSYTAYTQLSGAKTFIWSAIANVTAEKYATYKKDDITAQTKGISFANVLIVQDSSLGTSTAQVKAALSGQILHYELATPQTITIPRKHLGVVDLGDASNYYPEAIGSTSKRHEILFTAADHTRLGVPYPVNVPNNQKANAYCCRYYLETADHTYTGATPLSISVSAYNNGQSPDYGLMVYICDDAIYGMTASQMKDYLTGTKLFFETQDEVADILDTLDIEPGGTVNANWFSWVENQIVYDGNFANGTNDWFCLSTVYSQSVTNNVMTVTKNAGGAGLICSKSNSDITYITGHKFVALAQVKPSRNCSLNFDVSTVQTAQSMTANVWNTLSYFANPSSLTNYYFAIAETTNTLQVNDTVDIKNVMLIDLTLAFGAGNEPTSVNDPRIQYILNKGYIPTNTTGTYKLVDCEVLPNVEFKMKCK